MRQAIAAGVCAGIMLAGLQSARAGDWQWGCMGALGDQQLIFNRYYLIIAPPKPARGTLRDVVFRFDLAEEAKDIVEYSAADSNSGLTPKMEYTLGEDGKNKITLTEKSSKTTYHHAGMVCGRDETTDRTRKVYRYQRNDEPTRDVTLSCMEYMLTTRGGRPCIDRK